MSVAVVRKCVGCGAPLSRYNPEDLCSLCQQRGQPELAEEPEPSPREAWLWRGPELTGARGKVKIGPILREWRESHGFTQASLGRLLGWTQQYVSQLEGGKELDAIGQLRHISRMLEIPPQDLGLLPEAHNRLATVTAGTGVEEDGGVAASQRTWRRTRHYLNRHRAELARAAARLYEPQLCIAPTTLISAPGWLPAAPIDLADIQLEWVDQASPPVIGGAVEQAQALCPLWAPGQRYDRYTTAIRYLDPPSLFENRQSYRLLEVAWSDQRRAGRLAFSIATYFDKLDLAEALGHELAVRWCEHPPIIAVPPQRLPLRTVIGDPFDLTRRAVIPAVTTLTLRRSGPSASFLLHWRDPERVATAGGTYDVIPAGEFQPSSVAAHGQCNDLDLWHNMVREYSEELLGRPEYDGSASAPIDYANWPLFRDLERARADGQLTTHCLGVGLDALTLAATILTVVVIDDDVFDATLGAAVRVNAEGIIVSAGQDHTAAEGIPFTEQNVTRLLESEPMASPGAACLALASRHRATLLPT
jgi:transcriptional regulator with XRE-family HTH domain